MPTTSGAADTLQVETVKVKVLIMIHSQEPCEFVNTPLHVFSSFLYTHTHTYTHTHCPMAMGKGCSGILRYSAD